MARVVISGFGKRTIVHIVTLSSLLSLASCLTIEGLAVRFALGLPSSIVAISAIALALAVLASFTALRSDYLVAVGRQPLRLHSKVFAIQVLKQIAVFAATIVALCVLAAGFGAFAQIAVLPTMGIEFSTVAIAVWAQVLVVCISPFPVSYVLRHALPSQQLSLKIIALTAIALLISHAVGALASLVDFTAIRISARFAMQLIVGAGWLLGVFALCVGADGGFASSPIGIRPRTVGKHARSAVACTMSILLAFSLFGWVSPAEAAETAESKAAARAETAAAQSDSQQAVQTPAKPAETPAPAEPQSAAPVDYYGADEDIPGEPVAVEGDAALFQSGERQYSLVVGGRDVAYVDDDGIVRAIDNTLVETSSNDDPAYVNVANSYTATLPASLSEGQGIAIDKDGHHIEFVPQDGDFSRSFVEGAAIRYTEVQEGVDYQYTLVGSLIKEDIVLTREVEPRDFRTLLILSDGLVVAMEDGSAVVRDAQGEEVVAIGAPEMVDAAGTLSESVELSLESTSEGPLLTLSPDWDWIRAPERAYPVRIDPTVDVASTSMRVECVEESWGDVIIGENGYSYAGYDDGVASGTGDYNYGIGHGICRIYAAIDYDFSSIMSEARIDSATFSLYQRTSYSGGATNFGLYRNTSSWEFDGLTWNEQVGVQHELVQFRNALGYSGYLSWDVRQTVNDWVQGLYAQRGFCVKAENERWMQCEVFDGRYDANPPKLEVNWTIPDPVGDDYPLSDTTVQLRPIVEKSLEGLQAVDGVFADGMATPRATVVWQLDPRGDSGASYASRSYKYPDSSAWDESLPNATRYKDKLSNWQTALFTELANDTMYRVKAQPVLGSQTGASAESDPFLVYEAKTLDTLPSIASHYGVPLNTLAADNRVQDMLSIKGNTLFVRNPKTAVAYNPTDLSTDQKKRIDSALMGRGKHCEYGFEPVNMSTGNFTLESIDASIPDIEGDFALIRTYNSKAAGQNSMFGRGWAFEWDARLSMLDADTVVYQAGDGKVLYFERAADGSYSCELDPTLSLVPEAFTRGEDELMRWRLSRTNGESDLFDEWGMLVSRTSQLGLSTTVERDADERVSAIVSPSGFRYALALDDSGRVVKATLPSGSTLSYAYDAAGNLVSYTDANGATIAYAYDEGGRMASWTDADGNRVVSNAYDGEGRVTSQADAEGNVSSITYGDGSTTATDALGNVTVYRLDDLMRTVGVDYADGTSVERSYDEAGNLIADENGTYVYDEAGNLLSFTSPDGIVTSYEYDVGNRLVGQVNPDGETVSYTYDVVGDLVSTQSSSGASWSFAYDAGHHLVSATDADGVVTTYAYQGPWVSSQTDALGNTTMYAYDAMGNLVSTIDATGSTSRTMYDAVGNVTGQTDGAGAHVAYDLTAAGRVAAMVDARGYRTEFSYDARGNLVSMVDPVGGVESWSYDAAGNRVDHVDAAGNEESFSYDARGRLATSTDGTGAVTSYSYDARGNAVGVALPNGASYVYSYDATYGVPLSATDPLGATSQLTYDAAGRAESVTDPLGNTTAYTYAPGGLLMQTTDAAGNAATYTYSEAGRLQSVDVSGRIWSLSYDAAGRAVAIVDPEGNEWGMTLDAAGNLVAETDPLGNTTAYERDGAGRVTSKTDPLGNTTAYVYDAAGNLVKTVDPLGNESENAYDAFGQLLSATDALGNTQSFEYDAVGNLVAHVDARGYRSEFAFDAEGRLVAETDPAGATTTYAYDSLGNLVTTADAHGNVEERTYDAAGNLASVLHAAGLKTDLTRDAAGNVVAASDNADRMWTYFYDPLGNLVAETDPLGRAASTEYDAWGEIVSQTAFGGAKTTYAYDGLGNLKSQTDAVGGTTSYGYDAAGNLVLEVDANGGRTAFRRDAAGRVLAEIDAAGGVWVHAYDAAGNEVMSTDADGYTSTYAYDAVGNLISASDPLGNATGFSYDAAGNLATLVSPLGYVTALSYDSCGRVSSYRNGAGGETTYAYDAVGNLVSKTDPLGSKTTYEYDSRGLLLGETDALGGEKSYAYDLAGNLVSETDAKGATWKHAYDLGGRLTQTTAPLGRVLSYAYDASDNVTSVSDSLGLTHTYAYDALGRLTSATDSLGATRSWAYDSLGNVVGYADAAGGTSSYAYDALSRLISATDAEGATARYGYDARGNIVSAVSPAGRETTFAYDAAGNLRSRIDAAGNERTWSYDADGRVIASVDAAGTQAKYSYDGANRVVAEAFSGPTSADEPPSTLSAQAVSDSSETVTASGRTWSYDAAGNVVAATDATGNETAYAYDALSRLASVKDPLGGETSYVYDATSNLTLATDARGNATAYEHDVEGNLVSIASPSGATESIERDAAGRVVSYDDGSGRPVEYAYDAEGRLEGKSYPGTAEQPVEYAYDLRGMVAGRSDWTGDAARSYDGNGRIASEVDGAGNALEYAYDADGLLASVTYPDGSIATYAYDDADNLASIETDEGMWRFACDGEGRAVSVERPDGSITSWERDGLGRVAHVETADATGRVAASYSYERDGAGRIVSEKSDVEGLGHAERSFGYDAAGRLASCATTDDVGESLEEYAYDSAGNRVKKTVTRNGSAEGVEYAYDEDNRLVTAKYDGGAIVEYSYDDAGNLVSKSGGGQEWEYSYGVENRLAAVSEGGALVMAAAYDGDGARVWQATRYRAAAADLLPSTGDAPDLLAYALAQGLVAAIGTASPAASAGLAQRLAADWFRTGPGAGALPATDLAVEDLASRALAGGWRAEPGYEGYVFSGWAETAYVNSTVTDAVQVMASSGTLSGENDELYALGLADGTGILSADAPPRASDLLPAAAGELPWLSCGSGQVGLMEGADGLGVGLPRAASYGENTSSVTSLRLSAWGAAGSVSYSWDGRGSATSELDGAGALASSWSYSALGEVWSGASTDLPRYGWDAEEASPATGLVYLRARYLSVSEGVFTSRDLHLGSAANPATLNRRAYALADPVNLFDPLGLASWLSGVASRISSAASSPFARVAESVSRAFSAATSRFQSAMGAVQAAVGSAGSVSYRPSWAVTVAGYASHVSAAVIERCCGFAEHMGLTAPQPSGPSGPLDIVTSASPSDIGHGALDMLGFLPGIGIVADLVNAAWYLAEGDYANAGLSALSAIPGAGDAVGAGKVAFKGVTFVGGLASGGAKATEGAIGLASGARAGSKYSKELTKADEAIMSEGRKTPGQNSVIRTNQEAKERAESLGYHYVRVDKRTGELIFERNGNGSGPKYISRDRDAHNGGVWKGANKEEDITKNRQRRAGTYDADLNRIGD